MSRYLAVLLLAMGGVVSAHSGPPFPIVTERQAGPYTVSVWSDPDATDDGSPGGQFWVVFARDQRADVVSVIVTDANGRASVATAAPVDGDASRQFAAVVLDREGSYEVVVRLSGAAGNAELQARVDATYDLRPPPYLIAVYLLPFVLIGALWAKVLKRRHFSGPPGTRADT